MNSKVYIDGGVLIETPFFKYKNAGALYPTPPEGSETLKPHDNCNGEPCLIIKEEIIKGKRIVKAPSIFKEYYARTFFSTLNCFAVFFSNTIDDCFKAFYSKREDVYELLMKNDVNDSTRQILYRLSIVTIVAALDTLISDLVLFIATKDRNLFLSTIDFVVPSSAKNKLLERIIHMWCDNKIDSAEQEVIDYVLTKSYANLETIKSIMKSLYDINICWNNQIADIIYWRNLIAHRNGRKKDGTLIEFSKPDLYNHIEEINKYVENIRVNIIKSKTYNSHTTDL